AMKQSLKAWLPVIDEMTPLAAAIEMTAATRQRFVGYCDETVERRDLAAAYQSGADTVIFIGPEGDFSPSEIAMLMDAAVQPVTFGDNRLRTETAALYALSACHVLDSVAYNTNK
ncbi:MAG: RNA methyltransferase, partial [Duncaniella sp.]|nr:RNA methyltransferase [Duncaniella sp.]